MEPENPYSGKLVPSSCPPCLPALRDIVTNDVAILQVSQPPVYAEGLNQLAYLDVHNRSSQKQGFVVYPSTPKIETPSVAEMNMRIRVFQASKLLKGDNGTIRFALPYAPPLNWGNFNPKVQPGIIVIAGSRSANEDLTLGHTGGIRPIPSGSDWKLVSTGPRNGQQAKNVCVLSAPAGSEPFILTDTDMEARGFATMAENLNPGVFQILTDELLGTNKDSIVYAGIGAVNPNFPNDVVPIVTWDVISTTKYTVTADMRSWQVGALSNSAPATALDLSALPPSFPVTFAPAPEEHATSVFFEASNLFSNEA
ncbi:hypothetical protein TrVGV298_008172 [Trichoderma virens]|nr:hypothetical protein TrVGV298_008172 [Trichoderma virens]